MDTIYWHVNATHGGANLHRVQICTREQICTRVKIAHMSTALDGYMDKMVTGKICNFPVAKMATWTRRRLPQFLRWLHGQDGDYHNG